MIGLVGSVAPLAAVAALTVAFEMLSKVDELLVPESVNRLNEDRSFPLPLPLGSFGGPAPEGADRKGEGTAEEDALR